MLWSYAGKQSVSPGHSAGAAEPPSGDISFGLYLSEDNVPDCRTLNIEPGLSQSQSYSSLGPGNLGHWDSGWETRDINISVFLSAVPIGKSQPWWWLLQQGRGRGNIKPLRSKNNVTQKPEIVYRSRESRETVTEMYTITCHCHLSQNSYSFIH